MSNAASVHFYQGACSPPGAPACSESLIPLSEAEDVLLVRGGPGSGKTLFLSRIAEKLSESGASVEYLHTSGFPEELGAVIFPELRSAVAAGSACMESSCPGAVEHEISLDQFYDLAPLREKRKKILTLTVSFKSLFGRAARYFSAARSVSEDILGQVLSEETALRIAKRARGIAAREFRRVPGKTGTGKMRYLDAVAASGQLRRFDTVAALCENVYELVDNYGLSDCLLQVLRTEALAAGRDVIACPSPLDPGRLCHLLVPSLSLAFVTSSAGMPYPGKAYRRIRLDAVPGSAELRRRRTRLRFSKKILAALMEEGVQHLNQARSAAGELEALYAPHVDLDGVLLLAEGEGNRLLEKWNARKSDI